MKIAFEITTRGFPCIRLLDKRLYFFPIITSYPIKFLEIDETRRQGYFPLTTGFIELQEI